MPSIPIQTAIELAAELLPDEITGCLILIHPVNISGFENRTMSVVAEDGKNLNRIFLAIPMVPLAIKLLILS